MPKEKYFLRYTVETDVIGSKIHQKLFSQFNNKMEQLSERIMDTEETATKTALIALGWTPPSSSKHKKSK